MATAITKAIKGIGAEVRGESFSYRATLAHLGGGGTTYEKFNGRWNVVRPESVPSKTYRALRAKLNEAVRAALGKS